MARKLDQFDREAEREGNSIAMSNKMRVHVPKLRKTHHVDGFVFNTGEKHRAIGRNY